LFKIHLENTVITPINLKEVMQINSWKNEWELSLIKVLEEWFGLEDNISFFTSGSTGIPKKVDFTRKQIEGSAKLTALTFNLGQKSKALLCLHPKYVAGKMMVLRTIINGWELTVAEPSRIPFVDKQYDFSAMVPMQIESLIDENSESLEKIQKVIIGGAPISENLHRKILGLSNKCYATYGMTETLTHVAIQQLNGSDMSNCFTGLVGVELNQDENNCLNIIASHLCSDKIQTNDVVRFVDFGKFIWLGRYDNVINSGGVKIHPEQIEKKLEKLINRRLFIYGEEDDKLGEKVVLVIEGKRFDSITLNLLKNHLKDVLSKFEKPKKIISIPKMKETISGKLIREII